MLEVRYRVTFPGGAGNPFAPWFATAPGATITADEVRFLGDEVEARLIASAEGTLSVQALEDLLTATPPFPSTQEWHLIERHAEMVGLLHRWREPLLPGCPSSLRVAADVLGEDIQCSFVLTRDALRFRILVPEGVSVDGLWVPLRNNLVAWRERTGAHLVLEIERVAEWIPTGQLDPEDGKPILLTALMLGYYDSPPRATILDLARVTGVPGSVVLGHLRVMERELFNDPYRS